MALNVGSGPLGRWIKYQRSDARTPANRKSDPAGTRSNSDFDSTWASPFLADARATNVLAALLLVTGDFFGDFFLTGVLARGFFAAANALVALLLT